MAGGYAEDTMQYICAACKHVFQQFRLTCPECGGWKTIVPGTPACDPGVNAPVPLPGISVEHVVRVTAGEVTVDRVLGGGFVPGSSLLLAGPPGAGKSTLLLQLLDSMRLPALYVSGEESVQQLKIRADRLKINAPYISLLFETHVENILAQLKRSPAGVLVLDSIQTVQTGTSSAIPGSPTQMRKCAYLLRREAQERDVVLIIVGQVNKQNRAAGPKLIEHALDVLLFLESDEQDPQRRILSTSKNRFGSTVPCCFMTMGECGFVFHR